jgi:hypothetical protein
MTSTVNAYTRVALQLADLEAISRCDSDKLAQLIGVDADKYTKWAVGHLRMAGKYADRCRHIEKLAIDGHPLMFASIIDWESQKVYWRSGAISDHHFAAADGGGPPPGSGVLTNWRPGGPGPPR